MVVHSYMSIYCTSSIKRLPLGKTLVCTEAAALFRNYGFVVT